VSYSNGNRNANAIPPRIEKITLLSASFSTSGVIFIGQYEHVAELVLDYVRLLLLLVYLEISLLKSISV
jgi:hypothetical protein